MEAATLDRSETAAQVTGNSGLIDQILQETTIRQEDIEYSVARRGVADTEAVKISV